MMFKFSMGVILIVLEFQSCITTVINSKGEILSGPAEPREAHDISMKNYHQRLLGLRNGVSVTRSLVKRKAFMPFFGAQDSGMGSGPGSGMGFSPLRSGPGVGSWGSNFFPGLGQTGDAGLGSTESKTVNGASSRCESYYFVGARGTGEMPTGSIAYSQLEKTVKASIPGGATEELPYSSSADYFSTVTQGAQMGIKFITDQTLRCPNTVFVLVGYSKGAMVQTQIANSKDIPQDKVAAIVLFGNPYYRPGVEQNKCGGQATGIASMEGIKMPDQYADRTYDCCVPGDEICQTIGTLAVHINYPIQYQMDAAKFVIEKLKVKLG